MTQREALLLMIAQYNPQGINLLADKFGYDRPTSFDTRVGFLVAFLEDKGDEEGLKYVADIHPDKDLIIEAQKELHPVTVESRADGSPVATASPVITLSQMSPSPGYDLSNRQRLVILMIITALVYVIIKHSKD